MARSECRKCLFLWIPFGNIETEKGNIDDFRFRLVIDSLLAFFVLAMRKPPELFQSSRFHRRKYRLAACIETSTAEGRAPLKGFISLGRRCAQKKGSVPGMFA
jgi:hypothetical protein